MSGLRAITRGFSGILFFFMVFMVLIAAFCFAQSEEESFRADVANVYVLIKDLSSDQVSDIVNGMNRLLVEVDENKETATVTQWVAWSEEVHGYLIRAEEIRQFESSGASIQLFIVVAQLIVVVCLSYIVLKIFPGVFWGQWLRFKGDWRIEYED